MAQWGVESDKVLMLVTDNGSNMLKGVRLLREMVDNGNSRSETDTDTDEDTADSSELDVISSQPARKIFHRLPCLAHSLQLVVHSLDKLPSYTQLLGKARRIVQSVRKSSVATQRLIEKAGRTVVADCATRWNSSP